MKPFSPTRNGAKWKHPTGKMLMLLNAAHAQAMKHEPSREFPGVDIDAIHYKFGAVKKKRRAA